MQCASENLNCMRKLTKHFLNKHPYCPGVRFHINFVVCHCSMLSIPKKGHYFSEQAARDNREIYSGEYPPRFHLIIRRISESFSRVQTVITPVG